MKLHAQLTDGSNTITAYAADHVSINGQPVHTSFIVTPSTLIAPWAPRTVNRITDVDIQQLFALNFTVLLLGTGQRQKFPPAPLLRPLIERQIGVEVMDSSAACRTYNILVAEGRAVAAAIIIETHA
jgi:uncharacterized protein